MRKFFLAFYLFQLSIPFVFSDDVDQETLARILKDAVTIAVHSEIILQNEEKYWTSDITKVTVPGRKVTILFQTEKEKLSVELTPFKVDEENYMLTAVSNFWHEGEEGAQFRSSFKSINLLLGELILFYPLGLKAQEALTGGSLLMEMGIRIIPYTNNEE